CSDVEYVRLGERDRPRAPLQLAATDPAARDLDVELHLHRRDRIRYYGYGDNIGPSRPCGEGIVWLQPTLNGTRITSCPTRIFGDFGDGLSLPCSFQVPWGST